MESHPVVLKRRAAAAKIRCFGNLSKTPMLYENTTTKDHFYLCQCSNIATPVRFGFPGFLVRGKEGDHDVYGCFADWNIALRWLMNNEQNVPRELFDDIHDWLVRHATTWHAEIPRSEFQPSPGFHLLDTMGGDHSIGEWRTYQVFNNGGIYANTEYAERARARTARQEAMALKKNTSLGHVISTAAQPPDHLLHMEVFAVPALDATATRLLPVPSQNPLMHLSAPPMIPEPLNMDFTVRQPGHWTKKQKALLKRFGSTAAAALPQAGTVDCTSPCLNKSRVVNPKKRTFNEMERK